MIADYIPGNRIPDNKGLPPRCWHCGVKFSVQRYWNGFDGGQTIYLCLKCLKDPYGRK